MATGFHSETHLSDADLLERILSREPLVGHAAGCPACRDRAGALSALLDPSADDRILDDAPALLWSRQSARIRGRIAERPRSASLFAGFGFSAPRAIWGLAGASAAAVIVALIGLGTPAPVDAPGPAATAQVAAEWTTEDDSGDELLLEIDEIIDEDPWSFESIEG